MVEVNGTQLHYTDEGSGLRTVVFGHGLLWRVEMFGPQIDALCDRFRASRWIGVDRAAPRSQTSATTWTPSLRIWWR